MSAALTTISDEKITSFFTSSDSVVLLSVSSTEASVVIVVVSTSVSVSVTASVAGVCVQLARHTAVMATVSVFSKILFFIFPPISPYFFSDNGDSNPSSLQKKPMQASAAS